MADPSNIGVQNEGAVSIAEAYPAEEADEAEAELDAEPELSFEEQPPKSAKKPKELAPPLADFPAAQVEPALNDVAVPKPKNKPRVQLTPLDDEAEEEEDDEEEAYVPVKKSQKRKSAQQPQIPGYTYFPVQFGNTNGGAIAVANSFSTGAKGAATSHAIAYGSPASKRNKQRRQTNDQ